MADFNALLSSLCSIVAPEAKGFEHSRLAARNALASQVGPFA
jgi:hypothetical protein